MENKELESKFTKLVTLLTKHKKTIATMESCTGGGIANAITNIEGASQVLKYSAVTYSNEYKIKMGVSKQTIDTYTVYSMETAHEMAYHISKFANSSYGIGVTGKLNCQDPANQTGADNVIYLSIYASSEDHYYDLEITVYNNTRIENKKAIITAFLNQLLEIEMQKEQD